VIVNAGSIVRVIQGRCANVEGRSVIAYEDVLSEIFPEIDGLESFKRIEDLDHGSLVKPSKCKKEVVDFMESRSKG
jgi:hypothetical protein